MIAATWYDTPDATNWHKFVTIVQAAFHDGTLAEESMWQTVVLINKRAIGDFREIGMVEVISKTVTSLLNQQLKTSIMFHGVLLRFRAERGTRTTSPEAQLLQHLTSMR